MPETFDDLRSDTHSVKKRKVSPRKVISKLLFLLTIIALVLFAYLYYTTQRELQKLSTTQGQTELAQKEVKAVTDKLGKLTILPTDEPVVATILDAKLLATQSAFYTNAENGDKLVVYPTSQKAYIYSPSKNVIVNAGPLIVNQDQASRPVRFELRNGSGTPGAAAKLKSQLEQQQQLVSALSDASRKDYTQTLVIPINTAIKAEQLAEFAKTLNVGAKVQSQLPTGEAASEADILIIVGGGESPSIPAAQQPASSPTP